MRKTSLFLLILACLAASLGAVRISPGVLIFKTSAPLEIKSGRTGLGAFDAYLDQFQASNLRPVRGMPGNQYFLADLAVEPDWDLVRSGTLSFSGIEYIQPNYISTLHLTPNDPLYPNQFHQVTSNPQAWNYTTGSPLVLVGIVDSGILCDHPDLQSNIYVNPGEIPDNGIDDDGNGYVDDWRGWDFADAPELSDTAIGDYLGQDGDPTDENFHGTHVAGIVGAVGNNGIGVTGVAWNLKLLPVRAGFRTTQGQGYLQDDDAAAALIYAADMGCSVVNMSWGDPNYSPIIGDACLYAYNKGVTLVASAGNDPGPYLSYPAKLSTVISVGAVNKNRNLAGFSSYGIDMDIVAPGEAVLSTYKMEAGEQYFEQNGTSMSSPFVVGGIALLLSLHPGLTPDQVRARLLTATDDLGAPGFDQYYGHGLLNTRKLLENTDPPLLCMDFPLDQMGITGSVDITGTVLADDFFRFSVMYTTEEVPSNLDWYDVANHTNTPVYHTQPVSNGVLAQFYIPDAFAEGFYTLRIQYENQNGGKYNFYRMVKYDNTPAELRPESLQGFYRWDTQNKRYYISAVFNELVRTELTVHASDNSIFRCFGTQLDSLHVWDLPAGIPPGNISIQVSATNRSGLLTTTQLYEDFMDLEYEIVPNYGYSWQNIGVPRVPLPKTSDYDGDGYPEYMAMELPASGVGDVRVYQPGAGGHVVKHDFEDSFWLLDSGNTNAIGQELLLLRADQAVLMESLGDEIYPSLSLWSEGAITGGALADYSGDGVDDILLVKNLPTERVIQAYKRTSVSEITPKNTLQNTSPTDLRNTFVPTIIVKKLDSDTYKDILTADTDGDVMIYEIKNDNLAELSWSTRIPVGNTYYLTSGDFDGSGTNDFFVGGYHTDNLNPNLNFWYFEGFKSTANNTYTSMGSLMVNEVLSQNSIQSFDLDNDGSDEIILALSPNLYVLKYQNGSFKPVFYGNSFRSYTTLAYRDPNNRAYFITNYAVNPDSLVAVEWTSQDPFTGPPAPANFIVHPVDHQSVLLNWVDFGADYYRVWRKDGEGNVELIDNLSGSSYTDTGLTEGETYQYCITAMHHGYSPPESMPSLWQGVTPYHVPVVQSIEMVGLNQLRVMFDQPMANTILNPGFYLLSHGFEHPVSVNSISSQAGVQLHFRQALTDPGEPYLLTLTNITSANGVDLLQTVYGFDYVPDTTQPAVVSAVIGEDKRSVAVTFSEAISASPNPEHPVHYTLVCPPNDPGNSITTISHQDDTITLTFASNLRHSSKAYHLIINNITDLAGNLVSPQYNIARFALTDIRNLDNIVVYPNPVLAAEHSECVFINFPPGERGSIRIYNSAGDLVYRSSLGPFQPEINSISWRWGLANNDNRKVSSGIYYYVIEMKGETARGKIAVIR
jgi:subtilisin family serine protease